MGKADAAEAILSLTTSRDHAASIAGDLTQQAPHKGAIWFWGALIRTTTSLTWSAFTESPLRFTGLALLGLLVQVFYTLLFDIPIAVFRLGVLLERRPASPAPPAGFDAAVASGVGWEYFFVFLIASFCVGRWIAKRAPGRELVVVVAIWFTSHIVWIPVMALTTDGGGILPSLADLAANVVATVIGALVTFAGIKSMRRRMATTYFTD
jgi:hypothetical protein